MIIWFKEIIMENNFVSDLVCYFYLFLFLFFFVFADVISFIPLCIPGHHGYSVGPNVKFRVI